MIKGTVKTIDNEPIERANIYYDKDHTVGTTSNKNGEYTIPFHKDKGDIIFSVKGYEPDSVTPVDDTTYHCTMKEKADYLPPYEVKENFLAKVKKKEWVKWVVLLLVFGVVVTAVVWVTKKATAKRIEG